MIKTMKNKEAKIGDTSIFLATQQSFPKQSCDLATDLCGIQDEDSHGHSILTASEKPERPPLKRGISRNKSDPKILPVANVFLWL